MPSPHAQSGHRIRFEWGPVGSEQVPADIVVVVDVLSFTTTVTVAVDRGIEVLPHRWRDETAAVHAEQNDAALAVGRKAAGPGEVSLSPVTVRASSARRIVLPSPNGSTIAHEASGRGGSAVLAVSLRNRAAAAAWVSARLQEDPVRTVVAVAAGERWPDGSLRPAVEDLWGAGGFLDALQIDGNRSPEAHTAAAAYREVADQLPEALRGCASGQELIGYGFPADVEIAAEVDQSTVVPVLRDGVFR